ncbi:MAG: Alcohol dehydrogenase GroES domain protein [Gemmatimonadetes bacterium]|nr:Alcohol dehydrogenase GroES domain protein [Gemmatimonadota bacterium]
MSTMRAAVLVDVGRIEVMDVPRLDPSHSEVLVRVQAVGFCGTDIQIVAGHGNYNLDALGRPVPLADEPQILGHEIAGVVEEVGRDVRDLVAGERVIIDQGRTCISEHRTPVCEFCTSGDSHQCEDYREHGITGLPGGFAEFVTVSALNAVPLHSTLAPEHAALAEPLGCILHSMAMIGRSASRYRLEKASGDRAVRTVLICGGGPAGLLFLQHLRAVSNFDGLVLLSEPNAVRRSLAERWGAVAIDPSAGDLTEQVMERSSGRGAELLIEASGSGALFRDIPGSIRKQATVLLYGHGHSGVELSVMNQVQFREPTFVSPAGASGGHDTDGRPVIYRQALRLLEDGVIDVAPMITHRYSSLEDVPRAFAGEHRRPEYVKGVLLQ